MSSAKEQEWEYHQALRLPIEKRAASNTTEQHEVFQTDAPTSSLRRLSGL